MHKNSHAMSQYDQTNPYHNIVLQILHCKCTECAFKLFVGCCCFFSILWIITSNKTTFCDLTNHENSLVLGYLNDIISQWTNLVIKTSLLQTINVNNIVFFFVSVHAFSFVTEYRILGKKGEGTFSEVLKVQNIKDGTYRACKKMKQNYDRWVQEWKTHVCMIWEIMAKLKCHYCLQCVI